MNTAKKLLIAANWKMHKTSEEGVSFIQALTSRISSSPHRIFIAPAFTAIEACARAAEGSIVEIGAQNMSDADEGAFTGEISAKMLKGAGAQFVILGHSERRTHFGETDEQIHHKIRRAVIEKIPVILCIGESEADRERGDSASVLQKQLDVCLGKLQAEELKGLVIAYEPVWAIGTGKSATPEIAQETHAIIRRYLLDHFGEDFSSGCSILYGGSVKPENIQSLLNQPDIDGALIGGASLDVDAFTQMVQL